MSPTEDTTENVVSFHDGKPVSDFPFTMVERPGYCARQCRNVYVCEKRRMLQCRDCGKMIDPFDYMAQWARKGDGRMGTLKDMDVQIKQRSAELERLKMDVQNAKAQLKRAESA